MLRGMDDSRDLQIVSQKDRVSGWAAEGRQEPKSHSARVSSSFTKCLIDKRYPGPTKSQGRSKSSHQKKLKNPSRKGTFAIDSQSFRDFSLFF